ncbi:hypothetical protein [Streptomyces sp. NPDC049949]|uniref:hypothetical protein n=1 Tax=Streptomyces sp. NPDC049949 TaxID=3154627 RepID=UPI003427EF85
MTNDFPCVTGAPLRAWSSEVHMEMFSSDSTAAIGLADVLEPEPAKSSPTTKPLPSSAFSVPRTGPIPSTSHEVALPGSMEISAPSTACDRAGMEVNQEQALAVQRRNEQRILALAPVTGDGVKLRDGRLVLAVDADPDAEVPTELRVPDIEGLPPVVEKRRYDPQ